MERSTARNRLGCAVCPSSPSCPYRHTRSTTGNVLPTDSWLSFRHRLHEQMPPDLPFQPSQDEPGRHVPGERFHITIVDVVDAPVRENVGGLNRCDPPA